MGTTQQHSPSRCFHHKWSFVETWGSVGPMQSWVRAMVRERESMLAAFVSLKTRTIWKAFPVVRSYNTPRGYAALISTAHGSDMSHCQMKPEDSGAFTDLRTQVILPVAASFFHLPDLPRMSLSSLINQRTAGSYFQASSLTVLEDAEDGNGAETGRRCCHLAGLSWTRPLPVSDWKSIWCTLVALY